jgi:hypothetical protein
MSRTGCRLEIVPIVQETFYLGGGKRIPAFSVSGLENIGYCLKGGHMHYSRKRYDYYRINPAASTGSDKKCILRTWGQSEHTITS